MKITREEFLKQGNERFGPDFGNWVFVCSSCGFKQSRESIMKLAKEGKLVTMRYGPMTLEQLLKQKPAIDQECLSTDCDYVSYGLIPSTFCDKYEGIEVDGHYYFALANEVQ